MKGEESETQTPLYCQLAMYVYLPLDVSYHIVRVVPHVATKLHHPLVSFP